MSRQYDVFNQPLWIHQVGSHFVALVSSSFSSLPSSSSLEWYESPSYLQEEHPMSEQREQLRYSYSLQLE
jgi:hypothetical protein